MWKFTNVFILIAALYFVGTLARVAKNGRIVNGATAGRRQFPYIAFMIPHHALGDTLCGGSLISENYILTAAHCAVTPTSIDIRLGAWDTEDEHDSNVQKINIPKSNFILHPEYNPNTIKNDIALLKLPQRAVLNEYVQTIKLPSRNEVNRSLVNTMAIAAGWGATTTEYSSPRLQFIQKPIIDNNVCLPYYRRYVTNTNICIRTDNAQGTCFGDSGGPLVSANGEPTLIGLTSFGSYVNCEHGDPAAFTRVSSYLDWIEKNSDVKIH